MADTQDNSPLLKKQITISVDVISELNHKINQLESIIDLFSVAVDIANSAVFKKTLSSMLR